MCEVMEQIDEYVLHICISLPICLSVIDIRRDTVLLLIDVTNMHTYTKERGSSLQMPCSLDKMAVAVYCAHFAS